MPPTIKFKKEEIVNAALNVAGRKGIDRVTAREVAKELKVSVGPIFTYYDTMEQLKRDVYEKAKDVYRTYIEQGLKEEVPFLGVGRQYIRFAKNEPELYKLLFLTKPDGAGGSAMDALKFTQDLVRDSLMEIYRIDAHQADCYFRDMWLMAYGFAALIVTDDCAFTDEEISDIFGEVSLSICKAYKEIPGIAEGNYDKEALFKELIGD